MKWSLFNCDFDEEFYYSSLGIPEENPDILTYIIFTPESN
jgi:hypothetical protein